MKKSHKTILGILVFALFLTVAVFAYNALSGSYTPDSPKTDPAGTTAAREKAPDFTVYDAQGKAVKLSDFIGRPVVLNFWASWCPPCKSEMPGFEKIYGTVKEDVVFMMVDLTDGQQETQAKGQQYVDQQGFTFPVYFDTKLNAATRYGISSIPSTYIIDADGGISDYYIGGISEKTLRTAIEKVRP